MSYNSIHKLLILLAAVAVCSTIPLFAETEVSGEVSGVWDREGSPYIVVDSTWVPEGDSLRITAGVEVLFSPQTGLDIFGSFFVEGQVDDSVRVGFIEDSTTWKGLRFYGNKSVMFDYMSIVAPGDIIYLNEGYELTANHCSFQAEGGALIVDLNDDAGGVLGCNISFTECNVKCNCYFSTSGCWVTVRYSYFDFSECEWGEPGFHSHGTSYIFLKSEIRGTLIQSSGSSIIDSCRWLGTPNDPMVGASAAGRSGRMTETYVEGSAGAFWSSGEVIPFINNTILDNGGFGECSARIEGCSFGGRLLISECEEVEIKQTDVNGGLLVRNSGSVQVDSSYFIQPENEENRIYAYNTDRFLMTRSVVRFDLIICHDDVEDVTFNHNTLIFEPGGDYNGTVLHASPSSFSENIIIALAPIFQLFSWGDNEDDSLPPEFAYNCVYGFERYGGYGNSPIMGIDSTNVVADPLVEWDGIEPYLSVHSPCINRGNPDSPLDPDGTRADIGARSYDQPHHILRPFIEERFPGLLKLDTYPNPFNNAFKLSYELPSYSMVSIGLFDGMGRFVKEILSQKQCVGLNSCNIEASDLPAGVYILRLSTDNFQQNQKLLLIR